MSRSRRTPARSPRRRADGIPSMASGDALVRLQYKETIRP